MTTNRDIANSYALWGQYVDPQGLDSREAFDAMGLEGRLAFMVRCGFFAGLPEDWTDADYEAARIELALQPTATARAIYDAWEALEGKREAAATRTIRYNCHDSLEGDAAILVIDASSPQEAAERYVDQGIYDGGEQADVQVWPEGSERESGELITIRIGGDGRRVRA